MSNNAVEREEDDILYQLHPEAFKNGKIAVSLRAYKVVDFSSQYGSSDSISYTANNILGPPTIYPLVGDNAYSFQMRTYGEWWHTLPSTRKINTYLPYGTSVESQDFIDFLVEKRVTPFRLRVYEVFNPGAIVKIMCYSYDDRRWITLWKGDPQILPPDKSNCFSVEFNNISFETDLYRIEFHHKHLKYYCEIDGVILFGGESFQAFARKNPLSLAYMSGQKRLINFQVKAEPVSKEPPKPFIVVPKVHQVCYFDSKELPKPIIKVPKLHQVCYFDALPSEVVYLIISYLDLQSICVLSRVSRLFKELCSDPVLYRELNLQPYWHMVDAQALVCMESKLTSLQRLSLAWCGGQYRISSYDFIRFLGWCCINITSLNLANCQFVNDKSLKAIATYCLFLKDLELQHCRAEDLSQTGFKYISKMKNLTYLNLQRTLIHKNSLTLIIKSLQLEHLLLGSCVLLSDYYDIAKLIAIHLGKSLKTLDLWRSPSIGCPEILLIAQNCNNLVEIDLGWCYKIDASCGCIRQLIQNCPKLKKIFLAAIRTISNNDLNAIITYCPDVEQLDLLGTTDISVDAIKNLLKNCKKLKLLDVSYCDPLVKKALPTLEENFPRVQIKCATVHNFVY